MIYTHSVGSWQTGRNPVRELNMLSWTNEAWWWWWWLWWWIFQHYQQWPSLLSCFDVDKDMTWIEYMSADRYYDSCNDNTAKSFTLLPCIKYCYIVNARFTGVRWNLTYWLHLMYPPFRTRAYMAVIAILPVQVNPSPMYPALQSQVTLPGVLMQ